MFYAIISNFSGTSASYTGVVYNNMDDTIIEPHKEQGMYIEEMDTNLVPLNQAEILQYDMNMSMNPSGDHGTMPMPVYRPVEKEDAVEAISFYTNYTKKLKNEENFTFDGHEYYADDKSVQATQNQCLTMSDSDNIPVPNGAWKTAEVDGSGNPVFVSFTVGEFKNFAKTLFDRGAANFGVKESHIQALKVLESDNSKTVIDILNYDYSAGWNA